MLKANLRNIALDDCNEEKLDAIGNLCYEYRGYILLFLWASQAKLNIKLS